MDRFGILLLLTPSRQQQELTAYRPKLIVNLQDELKATKEVIGQQKYQLEQQQQQQQQQQRSQTKESSNKRIATGHTGQHARFEGIPSWHQEYAPRIVQNARSIWKVGGEVAEVFI
jgi:hypothetical protein